jgi:glycosyltransferase involved in cell wall biosynthesis
VQKILYLMHLPWDWIKQRPHFLAEELGRFADVTVAYRYYRVPFARQLVCNPVAPRTQVRPLVVLPFNRFPAVARINAAVLRTYLRRAVRECDIIWFTHPELFAAIREIVPASVQVVYDCMDNQKSFKTVVDRKGQAERIDAWERALLNRCNRVFASSAYLQRMLRDEYRYAGEVTVVNNGISLSFAAEGAPLPAAFEAAFSAPEFKLTFIGAIDSWMDFPLLAKALTAYPNLTINLVGPNVVPVPEIDRLRYLGPIPHHLLAEVMRLSDALVMPFQVSTLVEAMDPVKLYEYAWSGKPALASDYGETRKFGEFIQLYRDANEFLALLGRMMTGECRQRPRSDCAAFGEAHTWARRAEVMACHLGLAPRRS